MKRILLVLFLGLTGLAGTANARVELNFDFFFDTLSPYGEWASVPDYGYVWHPADVDEDWAPYSDGYWAYTDAGWTWVSYEEWGGVTYHYGRWVRLHGYGWCWVPDYQWGPAWVSWRQSDDYIGWAPLPPEARWRRQTGFGIWVDTEYNIGPGWFHFCHVRDFGAPFLRPVLLPRARNVTFIEQTINITNITYRNDRDIAFNSGPSFAAISLLSARPLPALKLVRHSNDIFAHGSRGHVFRAAPLGNTLVVAAPPVAANAGLAPVPRLPVARSLPTARIDHGWPGAANDPAHDRIRAHFKKQTEGVSPLTSPALAFQPALVAPVPTKANPKAKPFAGAPIAINREPSAPAVTPGIFAPPQPLAIPPTKNGRGSTTKALELPGTNIPPAIPGDPRGDQRGKKTPAIVEAPQPPLIAPPAAPKNAPSPATVPALPQPPVVTTPPARPAIVAEPRGDRSGKKFSNAPNAPQPALIMPRAPSGIAAPATIQPRDDSAARIAREQADKAARQRDMESAARAVENARRQQMATDERRRNDAGAAAAADKHRRDSMAVESARRNAESQRAAEMQRQQNEINARRAADQGRARQMEMQRQQQAATAAEAARRQPVAPRAPAPIAAPPPPRAPIQFPAPQARPNPPAFPFPAAPADPRQGRGRDDEKRKR